MVTAKLPPFAHSGDNVDVLVSALGDSTTLQGGTLVLTELRGPNNLVYATAQGPVSVGGFSAGANSAAGGQNSISVNFVTAGRVPNGAVIARDMITKLQQDPAGFSYVLSTPDYKTAAHAVSALNTQFGGGTAHALDAATCASPARQITQTIRSRSSPTPAICRSTPISSRRSSSTSAPARSSWAATSRWRRSRSRTATSRSRSRPTTPGRPAGPFSQRADRQPDEHVRSRPPRPARKLIYITGARDAQPGRPGAQHDRCLAARPDLDRAGAARIGLAPSRDRHHLMDPLNGLPGSAPLTAEQQTALKKLHDAATQLEGVFVGMLLKQMHSTVGTDTITGKQSPSRDDVEGHARREAGRPDRQARLASGSPRWSSRSCAPR